MSNNFEDVKAFHEKFGVPIGDEPHILDLDAFEFRLKFLREETDEFEDAFMEGDLAGMADALVDLVYVTLGTAAWMGLPWQKLWDEVQRANMDKVSAAESGDPDARHGFDVRKPEGWRPPDIEGVLERHIGTLRGRA